MFELNVHDLVIIVVILVFMYLVYSRLLQRPQEYRKISTNVPSITTSFWYEVARILSFGMKHPKGMF